MVNTVNISNRIGSTHNDSTCVVKHLLHTDFEAVVEPFLLFFSILLGISVKDENRYWLQLHVLDESLKYMYSSCNDLISTHRDWIEELKHRLLLNIVLHKDKCFKYYVRHFKWTRIWKVVHRFMWLSVVLRLITIKHTDII